MDKMNLASEILIEEINKRKEELHLTNAQLAEKCDMPESTLTKILNHSSKNPSYNALAKMADKIGVSIDETMHKTMEKVAEKAVSSSTNIPAKMLVSQEDKFLELFIENHQKQIADKNEQIKAKDRWIKTLVTIIILYACIFAVVTLLTLAHHDINLLKSTAQIFYSLPL